MNLVRTKPVTVVPLEQSYLSLQEAFAQAIALEVMLAERKLSPYRKNCNHDKPAAQDTTFTAQPSYDITPIA